MTDPNVENPVCASCGYPADPGDAVCSRCGAELGVRSAERGARSTEPTASDAAVDAGAGQEAGQEAGSGEQGAGSREQGAGSAEKATGNSGSNTMAPPGASLLSNSKKPSASSGDGGGSRKPGDGAETPPRVEVCIPRAFRQGFRRLVKVRIPQELAVRTEWAVLAPEDGELAAIVHWCHERDGGDEVSFTLHVPDTYVGTLSFALHLITKGEAVCRKSLSARLEVEVLAREEPPREVRIINHIGGNVNGHANDANVSAVINVNASETVSRMLADEVAADTWLPVVLHSGICPDAVARQIAKSSCERKLAPWVVIGIAAVMVAGLAVWMWLGNRNGDGSAPLPPPPTRIGALYKEVSHLYSEAMALDAGGVFASRQEELRDTWKAVNSLSARREWETMAAKLAEVRSDATTLIDLDSQRQKAREAETGMTGSRTGALDAGAETLAAMQWRNAGQLADEARQEFAGGNFNAARDKWAAAGQAYAGAGQAARNEQARMEQERLKTACNAARGQAETALAGLRSPQTMSPDQGFEPFLSEAGRLFAAAEQIRQENRWSDATQAFLVATEFIRQMQDAEKVRREAVSARDAMLAAATQAGAAGAETKAPDKWREAAAARDHAMTTFALAPDTLTTFLELKSRLSKATKLFAEAKTAFEAAARDTPGTPPDIETPAGEALDITFHTLPEKTVFHEGETITFVLRASRDCHVAILDHMSDGTTVLLFPNQWNTDTFVRGGREYRIPGDDKDGFEIVVSPPFGTDKVEVIVSPNYTELHKMIRHIVLNGAHRGMPFVVLDETRTRGLELLKKDIFQTSEGAGVLTETSIQIRTIP